MPLILATLRDSHYATSFDVIFACFAAYTPLTTRCRTPLHAAAARHAVCLSLYEINTA